MEGIKPKDKILTELLSMNAMTYIMCILYLCMCVLLVTVGIKWGNFQDEISLLKSVPFYVPFIAAGVPFRFLLIPFVDVTLSTIDNNREITRWLDTRDGDRFLSVDAYSMIQFKFEGEYYHGYIYEDKLVLNRSELMDYFQVVDGVLIFPEEQAKIMFPEPLYKGNNLRVYTKGLFYKEEGWEEEWAVYQHLV